MSDDSVLNREIQRIYDRDGIVLPETVVTEASAESHPLHGLFTWDDTEAGRKWRRHEASKLIRRATIVLTKEPDKVVEVRAFVSVESDGSRGYMPTRVALAEHRDQVLERALLDVAMLRRRYEGLCDFDEVLRRSLSSSPVAA